jgi:hypothetical protein
VVFDLHPLATAVPLLTAFEIRVDRVGGSDAFAPGVIYGSLQRMGDAAALDSVAMRSCLKHSIMVD